MLKNWEWRYVENILDDFPSKTNFVLYVDTNIYSVFDNCVESVQCSAYIDWIENPTKSGMYKDGTEGAIWFRPYDVEVKFN